jgi:TusA-related sulfurtransferase
LSETGADETLDLRGVTCPANAARALVRLEAMEPGELLEIVLDPGEPVASVPAALASAGHTVLSCLAGDGFFRLLVRVVD